MFGIKFFTEKSVFVDIESKVKPLDYGMVAMSSSWVMNLTRWLVISSVLTATRAAFSPEGKWNLCIRLIFRWALRSIFEATILSERCEAHTLQKKKNSAFPSSYFINNPIVEEKAKGLPTSRLDENSRRKDFFSFFSLFPPPPFLFRSSLKETTEKVSRRTGNSPWCSWKVKLRQYFSMVLFRFTKKPNQPSCIGTGRPS